MTQPRTGGSVIDYTLPGSLAFAQQALDDLALVPPELREALGYPVAELVDWQRRLEMAQEERCRTES